jgi:hypothetical protein
MTKRILLIIATIVTTTFILATPYTAVADTGLGTANYLPQCADTTLTNWDWPSAVKAVSGATSWSDFDVHSSSYIILHVANPFADGNVNNYNRYKIFANDGSSNLLYMNYTGTGSSATVNIVDKANYIRQANIESEPKSVPDYAHSTDQYVVSGGTTFSSVATKVWSGTVSDSTSYDCESVANNVGYENSFTFSHYNSNPLYGTGGISSCSSLDITCWVGKALTGAQNTLISVVSSILNALATWWLPDTTQVQADFNTFNSQMTAHLGFLVYPFTFFNGIYTAFTGSTSWSCSTTSCYKDFGNFYGHDFTVNFLTLKNTAPTMWTWFVTFIQGTTIITLVLAIRSQYMKTVRK